MSARTLGALTMIVPTLIAALAASYLTASHFSGALPACGPVAGCDVVANSRYSTVLGMPIALPGALGASGLAGLYLMWWRTGARSPLMAAYVVGLVALAGVAYLTFLELVVIRAICSWCVVYGVGTLAAWVVSLLLLRRPPETVHHDPGRAGHGRSAHGRSARRRQRD
ncbi:MAG TPA: vitamin K epoxide reductase family protein [Candidatus Limnocylindrales bacterium]|nr:vitamin K epoxide reductase family protein [Candidatus Limnocylindrales bacterium]